MQFDLDSGDKWASITAGVIALLGGIIAVARPLLARLGRSIRERRRQDPGSLAGPRKLQVREVSLDSLGVHRAITVNELRIIPQHGAKESHPTYIIRDYDRELRAAVAAARESSQFVLLLGGSSTGKSRSAAEAVMSELKEWDIVIPLTAMQLEETLKESGKWRNTVLWLNELQTFLGDGQNAVAVAARLVDILNKTNNILILGTLWPEYAKRYRRGSREESQAASLRALFARGKTISVPIKFSTTEILSGHTRAQSDSILKAALSTSSGREGAVTQTLAAGPDLIQHWRTAPNNYASSVITAVIDAKRLGVSKPLTLKQIKNLALSMLSPLDEARTQGNEQWFEEAIEYATEILRGAVSALQPSLLKDSQCVTYAVADYLYEHGKNERSRESVTSRFWEALVISIDDAASLESVADSARQRNSLEAATKLYAASIKLKNYRAASSLAELLASRLRNDEAEAVLASAFNEEPESVWVHYFRFLRVRNRLKEAEEVLRTSIEFEVDCHPTVGYVPLPYQETRFHDPMLGYTTLLQLFGPESELVDLLRSQGRTDEALDVWKHAVARGVPYAEQSVAHFLAEQGDTAGAELLLRECVARREPAARYALVSFLEQNGRNDEVLQTWSDGYEQKEPQSAKELASAKEGRGDIAGAELVLRDSIRSGDKTSYFHLSRLLDRTGRSLKAETVLETAIQNSVRGTRIELALLRASTGDTSSACGLLEAAAADQEPEAWEYLVRMLVVQDMNSSEAEKVLEPQVARGTRDAAGILSRLLMLRSQYEQAALSWHEVQLFDSDQDRRGLAGMHAWTGDFKSAENALRECISEGVRYSTTTLVNFLRATGRNDKITEAWQHGISTGEFDARGRLADHLVSLGQIADAEKALRDNLSAGDLNGGQRLGVFLIEQGRTKEAKDVLTQALNSGERTVGSVLFDLLVQLGELDEAGRLLESKVLAPIIERNLGFAKLYEAKGDPDTARRFLSKARESEAQIHPRRRSDVSENTKIPPRRDTSKNISSNADDTQSSQEKSLWKSFWRADWNSSRILVEFLIQEGRFNDAERVAKTSAILGEYRAFQNLGRLYEQMGLTTESQRARITGVAIGETR